MIHQFRDLGADELPEGVDCGISYTSVCINTPQYLHYLMGRCLRNRVAIHRANFNHLLEARNVHSSNRSADLIVNCTGLGSQKLGGVNDSALVPARGHVVIVRNETPDKITFISGTDDGSDETTYIMMRAAGGGTIIGGCYQEGQTDPTPDPALGQRILQRAVKLCPDLAGGKGVAGLDVIRHGVGLRPVRKGGPRIQIERLGGCLIVHNYGHGGFGYQASYGCARAAADLVAAALSDRARL